MIVDCYTHIWESPEQLGRDGVAGGMRNLFLRRTGERDTHLEAGVARHLAACEPVDTTIVLGFKSRYLDAEVSSREIADYVSRHPDKLIGFAGIDPAHPKEAVAEMRLAREELGMRGVAVSPASQDFHPSDSNASIVYREAADSGMPMLFHPGIHFSPACHLEYARPVLLDEVAREYPNLTMVIAHMGYPWVNETIVLLGKHDNVYSDISWLLHQPWQAYQALLSALQYGVMDKLLFGSGFPFTSAAECIESLYQINHLCHGTNLPTIPREKLRGIVERDTLALLGIPNPSCPPDRVANRAVFDEE